MFVIKVVWLHETLFKNRVLSARFA